MIIQFATNSYQAQSPTVSEERCVNMYVEHEPPDAKTPVPVFNCPGISSFADTGYSPVRGLSMFGTTLYAIGGTRLFRITTLGTAVEVGHSLLGSGVVSTATNGTQLVIVNGSEGYVYTEASGLQQISNSNFHAANTVTFFDQYFVFDRIGTNQIFISGVGDGTSYDALDFASAEVQDDNVVAVLNQAETLLVFGGKTIETWYDAANIDFPFQRYDGATIERGCAAPHTILKEDNSVFFLGDDRVFYRLEGVSPRRISTHAVEFAWTDFASVADAIAFSYTWAGHKFIVLTFPTDGLTFEYDIASGLWHERESWDGTNRSYGRWRGNCHVKAYGKEFIGDNYSGAIGSLSAQTFTEFGNTMRGLLISPPVHKDRKWVFMPRFELDVQSGMGLTLGQGSDPQIMMDYSDDGGRTYINLQRWRSMGQIGKYLQRLYWNKLGRARQRIIRITITDPVPRTIMSAHAELMQGLA